MDIDRAIRTGIYQALAGNVTLGGSPVEIYDAFALPEGVRYPYVLLSSQTAAQRSTKGKRPYDCTIVIDIVTGFLEPTGRESAEDIKEQIDAIVCPDDRADLDIESNGFRIGDTQITNSNDFSNRNEEYYVYRKVTTYGLLVSKYFG